jgi:hypothetical protein
MQLLLQAAVLVLQAAHQQMLQEMQAAQVQLLLVMFPQ